jgi:hypothetical protein
MTETNKIKSTLKGESNYHAWRSVIDLKCKSTTRGWRTIEPKLNPSDPTTYVWSTDQTKIQEAQEFILESIDDSCKNIISGDDSPAEMLRELQENFGGIYQDIHVLKQLCRELWFPRYKDPQEVFILFDEKLLKYKHAGGTLTESEQVEIIFGGLSHHKSDISFWGHIRGTLLETPINDWNVVNLRKYIRKKWHNFGGPAYVKARVQPKPLHANQVTWNPRKCNICEIERAGVRTRDGKRFLF